MRYNPISLVSAVSGFKEAQHWGRQQAEYPPPYATTRHPAFLVNTHHGLQFAYSADQSAKSGTEIMANNLTYASEHPP